MLAGITVDPLLGPLVACGAGGTAGRGARRRRRRLAPITDLEAARWSARCPRSRCSTATGARPRRTCRPSRTYCSRLGALADAHPEVAELDCNPVVVLERGAIVVDARVRVGAPRPGPLWPALGAEPPSSSFHGRPRRPGPDAAGSLSTLRSPHAD